ncbi:hypothetical protein SDC9_08491 [bioreactor metagenome]|uniref:Uncharacterized protein n=1 Tax=bioreactor metagenome TaxID=1076179 RepID=A0A644TAG5_9ZZZZ
MIKENKSLMYIFVCILVLGIVYFFLRINDIYFYFNLICYFIFLYFYISIFRSNFLKLNLYDQKFHAIWILFLTIGLFINLKSLGLILVGSLIGLLTSKIIFNPETYESFGKKIKNIPLYISVLMLFIGYISGNLLNWFLLVIQISFFIIIYNKSE